MRFHIEGQPGRMIVKEIISEYTQLCSPVRRLRRCRDALSGGGLRKQVSEEFTQAYAVEVRQVLVTRTRFGHVVGDCNKTATKRGHVRKSVCGALQPF